MYGQDRACVEPWLLDVCITLFRPGATRSGKYLFTKHGLTQTLLACRTVFPLEDIANHPLQYGHSISCLYFRTRTRSRVPLP